VDSRAGAASAGRPVERRAAAFPTRIEELRRPARKPLDAAATDHPAMFDASYAAAVNSRPPGRSGIARDSRTPPCGEIVMDARRRLKGRRRAGNFTEDEIGAIEPVTTAIDGKVAWRARLQ
jgi:predicted amidohydrolase YtcJ